MSETISPNTTIAQYTIFSKIGEGGMGEVYRARDTQLGREVAIKVLPATLSENADRLSRFEQEAQAAGALNHPNILVIYHIGSHEGAPYIVSELLEGETLRSRLSGGALPQRKALDFGLQVAKGLAAAHEKGIVHRDIKPENIFITNDGRAKILDFGLAKLTSAIDSSEPQSEVPTKKIKTDPGTVMGTVGYMSPEQLTGKPVDHRTDIFSFGAVLYEMLSGKRAFLGDSTPETKSAILREDPPALSETIKTISPALERVASHCLEKNPSERFQSASDFSFAIEALSGTGANSAQSATPTPSGVVDVPVKKSLSPNRFWTLSALAAALLGLAFFIVFRTAQRSENSPLVHYEVAPLDETTLKLVRSFGLAILPDGKSAILDDKMQTNRADISRVELRQGGERVSLVESPFDEFAAVLSPNGRWLAYQSNESGRPEIYVRNIDSGSRSQISTAGGEEANWSPNGRELYYRTGNRLYVVPVTARETFQTGEPKLVFNEAFDFRNNTSVTFDVNPKDGRVLMLRLVREPSAKAHVVVNWLSELRRLVTAK